MKNHKEAGFFGVAIVAGAALAGCGGGNGTANGLSGIPNANRIGLTATNGIVLFNNSDPTQVSSVIDIIGLQPGERIIALDERPSTGQLYGLGDSSRLYRINTSNGTATQVGNQFNALLQGISFGFDFNPVVDLIRITSSGGQNMRINPDTGEVIDGDINTNGLQTDNDLQYAAGDSGFGLQPNIVAIAYTNSVNGANTTELFGIDASRDVLVRISQPNNGVLTTVGPLGVNTDNQIGFDIVGNSGTGLAVLEINGDARLFSINLSTGAATAIGDLGNSSIISVSSL